MAWPSAASRKAPSPPNHPRAIGSMAMPSSSLRFLPLRSACALWAAAGLPNFLRSGINLLDAGTLCNQSSSSKKEKDGVFPQADVRPSSRTIFASPAYGAIIRLPTKPSQLPTMIAFLLISLPMA